MVELPPGGQGYAPDAPLIGEDTAGPVDATPYLLGTELDGVMNYRFRQAAVGFALTEMFVDSNGTIQPLSGVELGHALQAVLADYPPQAAAVSFNLVDSHDTSRIAYELGDAYQAKQRLVALLQFTTFGATTATRRASSSRTSRGTAIRTTLRRTRGPIRAARPIRR